MTGGRVPLHRSLVGRLLATSVLIALAAIVATAWLATQTTSRAIRQEQGRSLADDRSVYDTLVGYAAGHRDWAGVQRIVDARAAEIDRRITLMTEDRAVIADSGPGASLAAARPSAVVDPLRLDQQITGGGDRIDPRAVGPYLLPAEERRELRGSADEHLRCLADSGVEGRLSESPSGRPVVQLVSADPGGIFALCGAKAAAVSATEKRALTELSGLTAECLGRAPGEVSLARDHTVVDAKLTEREQARLRSCVDDARVRQLRPYVAPPALLFVTDPGDAVDEPVFLLSRDNLVRIGWVTGAVLLVTVLLTVLTGRRLVRPLRALTDAAMKPLDRPGPMPVAGDDEIGHLARALDDLTERRDRAEAQRRLMVNDVAHELRNPLTNIQGWLEAAQDRVVPAGPELLALLHDEAAVLRHIIDDLSDLAAADAGELRVHPEPVDVRDLLTQVVESHRGAAERGGIDLTAYVLSDALLHADPVRLRQMTGNLLSNAVRHTPPGGTVALTAAVQDDLLTVEVRDTGAGIAPDDLPRIFDRFWRADSSRTRATGGSGLGLPIARKLAEAHGGTLTARSSPGTGTTMTIRLPLGPAAPGDDRNPRS